jgi:predicted nucleic acid-binding protein
MPDAPVISNTSPLFYLHQIGQLELLRHTYGEIMVSAAVVTELQAGAGKGASVPPLEDLPWMHSVSLPAGAASHFEPELGRGEAEAIALAVTLPGSLLIMDDQRGRFTAKALRLRYTGTLGVLIKARRTGRLATLSPVLDQLRAAGMWISPRIVRETLRLAGE